MAKDAKGVFDAFASYYNTVKAFKEWGIKSYVVDPQLKEITTKDGVIYILPEMERVVKSIIEATKENTQ